MHVILLCSFYKLWATTTAKEREEEEEASKTHRSAAKEIGPKILRNKKQTMRLTQQTFLQVWEEVQGGCVCVSVCVRLCVSVIMLRALHVECLAKTAGNNRQQHQQLYLKYNFCHAPRFPPFAKRFPVFLPDLLPHPLHGGAELPLLLVNFVVVR